ncbi:hypothetical protein [Actinomadura geliboluensis]
MPDRGFYAQRRDEVRAVVDAAPDRRLVEIAGNHNVPMTQPSGLAAITVDLVRRLPRPASS